MKKIYLILAGLFPVIASAQTLTDGLMMQKKNLCTGFMYSHDRWKNYWEGDLKRDNGNIGKLTTQTITWVGVYGITDKINVIALLPYVKTDASQGTLHDMKGWQDASLAVKYNFFRREIGKNLFKAFGVLNGSTPISNYTPDFYPLSLGASSSNTTLRLTTYFRMEQGFFVNASVGHTWRTNVKLDRISYYDGNHLVRSNEVKMPNVFDVFVSAGYIKGALQAELSYMQQNTLGGADIRRQDMPFVSNRMNYIKTSALLMYYLPKPKGMALRGSYTITPTGRNVGQSTTLMAGVLYTIHFSKDQIN